VFAQEGKPEKHSLLIGMPILHTQTEFTVISGSAIVTPKPRYSVGFSMDYRYEFAPKHKIEIGYFAQAYGYAFNYEIPAGVLSSGYSYSADIKESFMMMSIPIKYSYTFKQTQFANFVAKIGYHYNRPLNFETEAFDPNWDAPSRITGYLNPKYIHSIHFELGMEKFRRKNQNFWYLSAFATYSSTKKNLGAYTISEDEIILSKFSTSYTGGFMGIQLAYIFNNSKEE